MTRGKLSNRELAEVFQTIADLLEIKGEVIYKILAYRKAADSLNNLGRDASEYWREDKLTEIPGVGKAIAEKIDELLTTGKLEFLEKLTAEVPSSLADLLQSVFPDLRRNKKLDMTVEAKDASDGYLRQMTFIQGQVGKAEQLIRDYLFRPGQTIQLGDLSSENMLMRLDWVEAVAKQVADRIL